MGKRRQSREIAMQQLYQIDLKADKDWDKVSLGLSSTIDISDDVIEYSERVVQAVLAKLDEIDKIIVSYATNWDIARIAIVDRNILRMSICELLYMKDIPPIVSINEAVDIAKKYGSEDSGKFVNGILDKIRLELLDKKG